MNEGGQIFGLGFDFEGGTGKVGGTVRPTSLVFIYFTLIIQMHI